MSNPVEQLLIDKNLYYSHSGKDFLIKCLDLNHTDSNPSCRVDKQTGIFHCFACGTKGNLFKFYGLLTNNISIRVVKLKEKLKALNESTNGLEPLDGASPITSPYRGISTSTLKLFGAFHTDKVSVMEDRIIFPIKDVRNKTICYVGRHTMSDASPRYQNYPAGAVLPLFPARFEVVPRTIILVEGLFDLLNCYDKGLRNVVATFGTVKLLSDVSNKMLSYKVMGIEKVFIMFDGDTAGREAAIKTKPLLEEAGFEVEIIDLPDGDDPGIMGQEDINSIIEYTK